jgi:hypothetical protein
MSTKENPKPSKQSRRKAPLEPLGWEEIISQPGMGGYLSFLNGPVPLPHLQMAVPESASTPEAVSTSDPSDAVPGVLSTAASYADSGAALAPDVALLPAVDPTPVAMPTSGKRHKIRKCIAAQDGHSLGEEILYQALWKIATPESAHSRTIVIGWRGMSQISRMTPKNCKINTHRLIRKLALEILSPYNTPESIGTTYRIYAEEAVLERRRAAGLEWVVRSRGVEFVNPANGGILPICAGT